MSRIMFKPIPGLADSRFIDLLHQMIPGYNYDSSFVDVKLYRCRQLHSVSAARLIYCNYNYFSGRFFENIDEFVIFINNNPEVVYFYNIGQADYQVDFAEACFWPDIYGELRVYRT